jgi:hypothetical protein
MPGSTSRIIANSCHEVDLQGVVPHHIGDGREAVRARMGRSDLVDEDVDTLLHRGDQPGRGRRIGQVDGHRDNRRGHCQFFQLGRHAQGSGHNADAFGGEARPMPAPAPVTIAVRHVSLRSMHES